MGTTPTTVNSAAQSVDSIIHSVIYDVAMNAAESAAIAAVPWLAYPLIKPIFEMLLNYFGGIIYKALAQAATLQVISFQTTAEVNAYLAAEMALRKAHMTGDQDDIDTATANFKKTFRSLIHFDGSASP